MTARLNTHPAIGQPVTATTPTGDASHTPNTPPATLTENASRDGNREARPSYRPLDYLDHSMLSPSGHVSKRVRKAATERLRDALFGPESGFTGFHTPTPQPTEKESLLLQAARLRDLASRGMCVRKYTKEADKLEALAATIGGHKDV